MAKGKDKPKKETKKLPKGKPPVKKGYDSSATKSTSDLAFEGSMENRGYARTIQV